MSCSAVPRQAEQPDFPDTFRMPARSAHKVLTAARLAARGLDAVARRFIDYGLPETVVADLRGLLERCASGELRETRDHEAD